MGSLAKKRLRGSLPVKHFACSDFNINCITVVRIYLLIYFYFFLMMSKSDFRDFLVK